MKRAILIVASLFLIAWPAEAQTAPAPLITYPSERQAVQGMVVITGATAIDGFVSAEVAFAYAGDPTDTWFVLATSNQPVTEDVLAVWDTTMITDGNYNLRLRVTLLDGSFVEAKVENLRVRNYTPIETPTPVPTSPQAPTATPTPTITPTATPYPTPTLLPTNPAEITPRDVWLSVGYGGIGTVVFLLFLGAYLALRRRG